MNKFYYSLLFMLLSITSKAQQIDLNYLIQIFEAKSENAETMLLSKGFIFSNYQEEGGEKYTYEYPTKPDTSLIIYNGDNNYFNYVTFNTTDVDKYLELKDGISKLKLIHYTRTNASNGSAISNVYCKNDREFDFLQGKFGGKTRYIITISDYRFVVEASDTFKKHKCQ
ncbi:hypothetical protein [Kaistella montana]|uniref:Uncharacterized protein n=1 Tax=Kaistella montana TaxID=1849733 RepID=A0ABW5K7W9_9FLAO|nr:hypothetical protein [Kaistella montana]MCQ4035066.1 hypothetical protein [Kaistella montana]